MPSRTIPLFSWFLTKWRGSLRLRHTLVLSGMILLIMGLISTVMLSVQRSSLHEGVEAKGLAFTQAFALGGWAAVHGNLFRIQEALLEYSKDPDIRGIEVIDKDNMIVAAQNPQQIGLVLEDRPWLDMKQQKQEVVRYDEGPTGEQLLIIVAPLIGKGQIEAWIRVIFSLDDLRREETQLVLRMTVLTLILMAAGILGVQWAQKQVAGLLQKVSNHLQEALAKLKVASGDPVMEESKGAALPTRENLDRGDIEYLGETVTETVNLLKSKSEELRESEMRFRSVAQSANDAIISADYAGNIISWNRGAETIFGYGEKEVLGKPLTVLMPERYRELHRTGLERLVATGEERILGKTLEWYGVRKNGSEFPLDLSIATWKTEGGTFFSGIIRDITERKQATEALQALTASLEQRVQERTAELEIARDQALMATEHKSEFLAGMSHELRTPLNAVIGFSEVLLAKMFGEVNPKQEEYLQDILSSGRHLLALINDILDLAKIESGRMELELTTFDLPTLLRDTLTMMRERATRKGIETILEIDSQLGHCTADERKVKQTLLNLLSNALKFTPEGGSIFLKAIPNSGVVEISVTDTGIGIAPDHQEKVFDEFYQAGGNYIGKREGSGLGLALTKKFIELHGGKILVTSEVGRGSTFTFSLPIRESIEKVSVLSIEASSVQQDRSLVLVVEDDPSASKLLSLYLAEAGFAVEFANSGEVGLEKARRLRPGVIMLDILMQGLDGWEFLSCLKNDRTIAGIPVVIVSILDERGKGFSLGAADYLVKPVDRDDVISAVHRVARASHAQPDRTILIIDDDPMVLELMQAVLEPEGFIVLQAGSGREGMALAQEQRPHLIVLDLLMPDVDGFQVLDELKSDPLTASIPIMVLTCKTLTSSERAVLTGRISDLVQKGGFSRADFLVHIRSLLELEPY